MTHDRATPQGNGEKASQQKVVSASYYGLLGLHPSASVREIRQAYRELSKLYHPDTTVLATAIATNKFQQINEAYATLSSPERRTAYDRKIGYANVPVIQRPQTFEQSNGVARAVRSSSAYLDATDRPLSPGEIFALFILGLTFVGCLVLAIAIGITRGEAVLQPNAVHPHALGQEVTIVKTSASTQPITSQPTSSQSEMPVADTALEPSSAIPDT
ncbi:MAG: J domain-containing protein [Stenomitos frigidus ULC029]